MPDYQRTKIYKIEPTCAHDVGEIYIGSTSKQYLSQRWGNHTSAYKRNCSSTSSKILFDKYGLENCRIELLETYPCNSIEERNKREREWYDKLDCINKYKPCCSADERREVQKEHEAKPENKARKKELQLIRRKKDNYTEEEWSKMMLKQREYRQAKKAAIQLEQPI